MRELGARRTIFRVLWELQQRGAPLRQLFPANSVGGDAVLPERALRLAPAGWMWGDPGAVAGALNRQLDPSALERLRRLAGEAVEGRILCFGRWSADFGRPPDWLLNPVSGQRWDPRASGAQVMSDRPRVGDIKLTWEAARFPHAYLMARAAAFFPGQAAALASALLEQLEHFVEANLRGRGPHWVSGQEVAFRLMAWTFSLATLLSRQPLAQRATAVIGRALAEGAAHIEQHINYSRFAVYNNHLLSEALLLYLAGSLLDGHPDAQRWTETGRDLLEQQADRQFYRDGGYIQMSHNHQRVALQDLLWAWVICRWRGEDPPAAWRGALANSVDFLAFHQNPADGRLPNYGCNDGTLPSPLSSCDYADFRPTLQAASLAARGVRLYGPGPWDEEAAWMLGPDALDAPLRAPTRYSVSFADTGFHLLRCGDGGSFGAFRCGTIRDRFSQIDMLHLDLWWRGHNVLVDGGSYLYNGPPVWNEHFTRTAVHNTLTVDGDDQMLHHRQFKVLYWTRCQLLAFEGHDEYAICGGEHYGYARRPNRCVHRRFVLQVGDGLWVVVDRVSGSGEHALRLHWLGGEFPHRQQGGLARLALQTPSGPFSVTVVDEQGHPVPGDVVAGRRDPPRGWSSRYYGQIVAVPSLAVNRAGRLPLTLVSILCAGEPSWEVTAGRWTVHGGGRRAAFRIVEGRLTAVEVDDRDPGQD